MRCIAIVGFRQKIEKANAAFLHDTLHFSESGSLCICFAGSRDPISAYLLYNTTVSIYAQQVQAEPEVDYLIQSEKILSRKCGIYQCK